MKINNDKRNDLIVKLRSEGHSLSAIARLVGTTRSTVAGVLFRAGVMDKRVYVPKTTVARRTVPKAIPKPKAVPFAPISLVEPDPIGEVEGGCTFLHGEPVERNFCGHPVKWGSSFCPSHHARCWTIQCKLGMKVAA